MWLYDESGYLRYVKLSPVDTCRSCRKKFVRKVEVVSFSNKMHEDRCPHCGYVKGVSESIVFTNTLLEGAV